MSNPQIKAFVVDVDRLPVDFPTQRHDGAFWEAVGRAVATFGFLEEVLGRAIFAFTATREFAPDKIEAEYANWLPTLEKALVDALGSLIASYGRHARAHQNAPAYLDDLLAKLREATVWRNTICHASWRPPDQQGRSLPFYVDKKQGVFETSVDIAMLRQLQRHVAELACAVVSTVTEMGYQFPGSNGAGKPIMTGFP
ncbi:hypothetical protein [Bradyrhizobium sp.]|uniref:hypothetical protein n=1 Tax=Bradyrhizobium sp. TaxID=376 RepID=UPI001DEDD924|nr:hypothetical protein [Bradyrhizobium sp.]MBI5323074.1 hypothetical protein [Bradyrhizobium sp.]